MAALADSMSATDVAVTLVNLSQVAGRSLVMQAGAYGEHRFGGHRKSTSALPC